MQKYHPHPVNIFENMAQFLFLLIIPLVRGLLTSTDGFGTWIEGAWMDIAVLLLIFTLSAVKWMMTTYEICQTGLQVQMGILIRKSFFLPQQKLASIVIEAPFHLIPFHAVKLKCDTDSGNPKKYDFTITISKDRAADILKRREQLNTSKNFVKRSYRPKNIYVFVLSALLSNSFAGVIFAAAFISNTGKLLGEQFESRLVGTFAQYAKLFAFGLPPAAAAVGYLLLFGWLIAFSRNLIRHKNLVVTRNHTSLYIKSGIFTKRKFSLLTKHINYIDIRQSISTKLLGLSSVFVNCTGYGKEKNESSVLMPPIGKRELADNLSVLFPEVHYKKPTMRPNFFSIFKFIADPAWYLLGVTAGMIVTTYLFASWKNLIFWIGGMAIVPGVWFLILRIVDFATTGIAANERGFTLKYSKGFTLHTVYIPVEKVTQVLLRQSILQLGDNSCDVFVYSYNEGTQKHHVKNLHFDKVVDTFSLGKVDFKVKPERESGIFLIGDLG